ncbi:MAG TPA: Crp/Fnr family transcriptional regulator [Candidatus Saccharimonadales bacterium]|nr:Crp/Fnr family transcriptional regulator [Candidatus Saccharimonadales bacterium]
MYPAVGKKVAEFFTNYPPRRFAKGELLIRAEEEPRGIFYITKGHVNQYDISLSGIDVFVNVFKPPAFFPMSWAMNKTPNHYFFEAATFVTARLAPPDETVAFLKKNPDVLFDLLARVYRGTDGMQRRLAHIVGGDSKSRVIFELLNAAARFGVDEKAAQAVFIPLRQGELAQHAGLTRETVSRTMQQLKDSGLAEAARGGIVIHNVAGLESMLGSQL